MNAESGQNSHEVVVRRRLTTTRTEVATFILRRSDHEAIEETDPEVLCRLIPGVSWEPSADIEVEATDYEMVSVTPAEPVNAAGSADFPANSVDSDPACAADDEPEDDHASAWTASVSGHPPGPPPRPEQLPAGYYSVNQAAAWSRFRPQKLRDWIRDGRLLTTKWGRRLLLHQKYFTAVMAAWRQGRQYDGPPPTLRSL